MINPGKYKAAVRAVEFDEAGTGAERVAVLFELADDAGSITWHGYLTPKAEERTLENLRNLGWTGDDISELPALADAGKLTQSVEVVVVHETFKDVVSAKIKYINGPNGRVKPAKPIEGDKLAQMAARIKASIRGETPPVLPPDAARSPDDDIPF